MRVRANSCGTSVVCRVVLAMICVPVFRELTARLVGIRQFILIFTLGTVRSYIFPTILNGDYLAFTS